MLSFYFYMFASFICNKKYDRCDNFKVFFLFSRRLSGKSWMVHMYTVQHTPAVVACPTEVTDTHTQVQRHLNKRYEYSGKTDFHIHFHIFKFILMHTKQGTSFAYNFSFWNKGSLKRDFWEEKWSLYQQKKRSFFSLSRLSCNHRASRSTGSSYLLFQWRKTVSLVYYYTNLCKQWVKCVKKCFNHCCTGPA